MEEAPAFLGQQDEAHVHVQRDADREVALHAGLVEPAEIRNQVHGPRGRRILHVGADERPEHANGRDGADRSDPLDGGDRRSGRLKPGDDLRPFPVDQVFPISLSIGEKDCAVSGL